MIVANFIVDYVSFVQTLVIVRIASKADSKKSLIILLFTDILATINIFTLAYAFFLSLGLLLILNPRMETPFVVRVQNVESLNEFRATADRLGIQNVLEYENVKVVRLFAENRGAYTRLSTVYVLSRTAVAEGDIGSPLNAFAQRYSFISGPLVPAIGRAELDYQIQEYQFRGTIRHRLNQTQRWFPWYTYSYLQSDAVQDEFIIVASLDPGFSPLDEVRRRANSHIAGLNDRRDTLAWCADSGLLLKADVACDNPLL